MSKVEAPCKNCEHRVVGEDRETGCHSHCEIYKKYQRDKEDDKENYRKSLIYESYVSRKMKRGQK